MRQRVEKRFPVRVRCFQVKEFEARALSKKGLDFVIADLKKIVGEFFFVISFFDIV